MNQRADRLRPAAAFPLGRRPSPLAAIRHRAKRRARSRRQSSRTSRSRPSWPGIGSAGFGSLRPRTWATFDDLTFIPGTLTRIPLEGYREKCATAHGSRHAVRRQADRAGNAPHGDRDELRGPLAQRQDGPLPRSAAGGNLDDHRRRRDARRRAHRVARDDLRGPAQPLRDQHPAPPPGRRDRADDRPGGQAGDRRIAAGLQGLRGDRPHPRPPARRRSALAVPASRLPRARRPRDQDRGAARGDRLSRCRSSSRWGPRASSTTSGWRPRPAPT